MIKIPVKYTPTEPTPIPIKIIPKGKVRSLFLENIMNIQDRASLEYFLKFIIGEDRYNQHINLYGSLLKNIYNINSEAYCTRKAYSEFKRRRNYTKNQIKNIITKPKI